MSHRSPNARRNRQRARDRERRRKELLHVAMVKVIEALSAGLVALLVAWAGSHVA